MTQDNRDIQTDDGPINATAAQALIQRCELEFREHGHKLPQSLQTTVHTLMQAADGAFASRWENAYEAQSSSGTRSSGGSGSGTQRTPA